MLELLPPVFRQSNTTFVNLRAALDDLDPLVETAKPATKNLAPFLRDLRPVLTRSIPVFRNLRLTVARPGFANDSAELLATLPAVQQRASKAFPHAEGAIEAFQPNLNFFRVYAPDLLNGLGRVGQVTGNYDGNGNYARVSFSDLNLFERDPSTGVLEPIKPSEQFNALGPPVAGQAALPGSGDPARPRRLEPVPRPAVRRRRYQQLRMQSERSAAGIMKKRSRKKTLIGIGVAAAIVLLIILISGSRSENGYLVRAIFDNGSFLVPGEEVRVAGASVGTIQSVGVTMPGEVASYENGRFTDAPGKAVLVLKIDDPGFQDFRQDASCEIRPQSLIGEKYVDCRTTLPHAAGTEDNSPPLKVIPDGQPGAGQHLLPLQQNSASVDPDLVNDIQRLPYAQRFRLIINELGATLAGRGEDVEQAVRRANPVLRDAGRLFQILSNQRDQLAQLSTNSEQILEPFAEQRAHVAGFLSNSGATAEASAERGAELEASLKKLPGFITEFESTLRSLQGFSTAATPVFGDLNRATPALTEATRALTPFSAAATVSLKSLGASGELAGPKFAEADPIVRKARNLAKSGVVPTSELARFLASTNQSNGFKRWST